MPFNLILIAEPHALVPDFSRIMKTPIKLLPILPLACLSVIHAAEPSEAIFTQRRDALIAEVRKNAPPEQLKNPGLAAEVTLLDLFENRNTEEANIKVLAYCHAGHTINYGGRVYFHNRSDEILRIGLLEETRQRLTREALKAVEDHAWLILTEHPQGMSRAWLDSVDTPVLLLPNNGNTNRWRRYTLALRIALLAKRYGPEKKLGDHTLENHWQAWENFWIRFFKTFPKEGTDMDIAHPGSYAQCTIGVMYDMHDLSGNAEIRRLAGNYLTLFWAEVAAEFDPRTGYRLGLATTREPNNFAKGFWAKDLLHCYQWHDNQPTGHLGSALFLTSGYRPPKILAAIANKPDRGSYLATGRRPGLASTPAIKEILVNHLEGPKWPGVIIDKDGSSRFRRDVWMTPDYALGTLTTDPTCDYVNELKLTQNVGATFPTPDLGRIQVMGRGYYPERPTNGITGPGVSIIARDPNAKFGEGRFMSNGTRVFISNGPLWDNRVEDPSGWFFTRNGNAYAAIRPAAGGYVTPSPGMISYFDDPMKADRKVISVEEKRGHYLELNDMWAPVVIQMGRAKDFESFEAFQTSVKENPFTYADGKLSYTSEAGDTYEAWMKFPQLPKINGETINLNPEHTFHSPFLKMKHGTNMAVISCAGQEDVVLKF